MDKKIHSVVVPFGSNSSSTKSGVNSTKVERSQHEKIQDREVEHMKTVKLNQTLKELMSKHGLKLKALSKASGIPLSTLGSYTASSKSAYRPEHIAKLCDYFNVTSDFLLFGETNGSEALGALLTEQVFDGFLKVRVERVIPNKKDQKE